MPLKSNGPSGWVRFDSGVKFTMNNETGKTVLIAVESEVLDFFEHKRPDEDVACFYRFRDRIERIASGLYDGGACEDGLVAVTYGALRSL